MTPAPPLAAWSIDAALVPLPGGARNRVLRRRGRGQDLVFKTTGRSAAALAWLAPVQAAARQAGFVVPDLIPTTAGARSAGGWTCEAFLDSTPFDSPDMSELAPRLRAFHAATRDLPQRPGFLSSEDLVTREAGGDIDLTALPDALAEEIRSAFQGIDSKAECAIHGDLNPGNLLRLPDGGIALIDWDEARRDRPLFDLAAVTDVDPAARRAALAWEIACCWRVEPARARQLARGFL